MSCARGHGVWAGNHVQWLVRVQNLSSKTDWQRDGEIILRFSAWGSDATDVQCGTPWKGGGGRGGLYRAVKLSIGFQEKFCSDLRKVDVKSPERVFLFTTMCLLYGRGSGQCALRLCVPQ